MRSKQQRFYNCGLHGDCMEEIRQQVREIIAGISRIDSGELADDVHAREELGIDSLKALEIIATVERKLDIHIDEERFADIKTVGDFLDLAAELYQRRGEQS